MNLKDTVTWKHSRHGSLEPGWAGDGLATIRNYDPARAFFGGPVGSGNAGPAIEIELLHNGLRCWVPPQEIEAETVDDAEPAN